MNKEIILIVFERFAKICKADIYFMKIYLRYMFDDRKIRILALISIVLGIVVLFFSVDYDVDDGFFFEENDYVYLDGIVVSIRGSSAVVYACRNITVFGEGLNENEYVMLKGSMYRGRLSVDDIRIT